MRKASFYGEAVSKLFNGIRQQLTREEPKRQAFLRLVKEIVDFIAHQRRKPGQPVLAP